ncbi:peptidase [Streptococcus oralis]|uniref:Peptidase n=1 Tax=Streptococcus oralis subsp. tigurinus TaxID=1077464 RepID=A0AAX0N4P2_STROR|nr:peptidase [Streptococcus oralis]MBS3688267.1 peptidase [Streptococcus oralis]MCY7082143.1 peptidase [Streptococcus oralis]MCY7106010.1 peptidase [Streptococcus oralis]ORO32889.1 peptidase [Streptococcus oralis subsp. tigurinus]
MQMYFGDVSLCYSYSLAMALDAYGYDYKAEFLEAIMAMGNGASIVKEDDQHPLVFFDNGMPDLSISHSLKILGFDYEDFYLKGGAEVDLEEIKRKLETFLFNGPVVLGPLDMGHLTYNPNHTILYGVDHFVTVYDIDDQYLYLHDPAGFACMKVAFNDILEAWKAEAIDYKRGAYSMWGNFKRLKTPSQTEIYQETAKIMKNRYLNGQNDILECYAKAVVENGLNTEQKQLHQYFSFKLAAVRNLYLSKFLKDHDPEGARLKEELATLFGQAHLSCLKEDYQELAHLLYQIAEVDGRFRDLYVN